MSNYLKATTLSCCLSNYSPFRRQLAPRRFSAAGELDSNAMRARVPLLSAASGSSQHLKPVGNQIPFFAYLNGILVPWTCFWAVCIFSPWHQEDVSSSSQSINSCQVSGPHAFSSMTQLSQKTLCLAAAPFSSPRAVPGLAAAGLPDPEQFETEEEIDPLMFLQSEVLQV